LTARALSTLSSFLRPLTGGEATIVWRNAEPVTLPLSILAGG
jgi:hypothetical protein